MSTIGYGIKQPPYILARSENLPLNYILSRLRRRRMNPDSTVPPQKRPRGRPKLVKPVDPNAPAGTPGASPSGESTGSLTDFGGDYNGSDGTPKVGDNGKRKAPLKKTDKRLLANKEQAKKDREAAAAAAAASGSADDGAAGSSGGGMSSLTPTAGLGDAQPSTGNPLKVRSISTGVFTQALLGSLMTGPPLSITEISKLIPNVTLDQLQGILDTLQMFGIIDKIQLSEEYVDPDSVEYDPVPTTGNSSRKPVPRTQKLYCMAGFIRGTSSIDIRTLVPDTMKRKAQALATTERVAKIQKFNDELVDMGINPEERSKRAEQFLKDLLSSDPCLSENPLYQHISKQLIPPEVEVVPDDETKAEEKQGEMVVETEEQEREVTEEVTPESTEA